MTLNKEFNKWKAQNDQHGRQAFSRFVMLKFLDGLQLTSTDFVFKGGNLLWHYINTPRETIDLDLATISLKSHLEVKGVIEDSFKKHSEIKFSIKEFSEVGESSQVGASLIVSYETLTGQRNQFSIDIVYAIPTDISNIKSTLDGRTCVAASIENIVCDKLSAAHQFKGGNTRMKDYDDLWRIINSDISVDSDKLKELLSKRNIPLYLEESWIHFLEDSWKRHAKSYKDVPRNLKDIFDELGKWLNRL